MVIAAAIWNGTAAMGDPATEPRHHPSAATASVPAASVVATVNACFVRKATHDTAAPNATSPVARTRMRIGQPPRYHIERLRLGTRLVHRRAAVPRRA